ncbi:MAG: hypothetical protein ACRDS9_25275, partial [Pseudonocardiaceae bacterium]
SKQVTQNLDQIINKTDGRVIYTMETIEEPVISYNDMAFIPPNNSVVFRAGDAPVWNRNETIMPMMWKLGGNKIVHPGHDYSLQTIPTLSSALDFDVRRNQPDFIAMLDKRLAQAVCAGDAKMLYGSAHGYTSFDIERLDPDVYADEVMEIIESMTTGETGHEVSDATILDADDFAARMCSDPDAFVENIAVANEVAERSARQAQMNRLLYAEGLVSPAMLIRPDGTARTGSLVKEISEAYRRCVVDLERDSDHFSVGGAGELRSADGTHTYITTIRSDALRAALDKLHHAGSDPNGRVYAESETGEKDLNTMTTIEIHADLYTYLASLPTWEHLAGGRFDHAMAVEMRNNS